MAELKTEIDWENKKVEITLKSLTYGDWKKIRRKSIIVQEGQSFRDLDLYDELMLLTSIKDCPFDKTLLNLRKISMKDGVRLETLIGKLNIADDTDKPDK